MVNINSVGMDPKLPGYLGISWTQPVFSEDGQTVKDVTYRAALRLVNLEVVEETQLFQLAQHNVQ
jgi:hypothetical protein